MRQLQPADLSADDGRELSGLDRGAIPGEQVGLLLVGGEAAVPELEGLERAEVRLLIINREVVLVLVLPIGQRDGLIISMQQQRSARTNLFVGLLIEGESQRDLRLGGLGYCGCRHS